MELWKILNPKESKKRKNKKQRINEKTENKQQDWRFKSNYIGNHTQRKCLNPPIKRQRLSN